ncbi:MAG: hypothetical protein HOH19_02385 [Kordiimonadaceae bacterium]|nr:hypothetical protein [Kordiimonadaceae bacterium]MBT6031396.1 hypothetical protein [Kordiimonadaceae bacterium]
MDVFSELKRRNIFKVAIAYLALGWIVVQVTDVAVPSLNLSPEINGIVFYIWLIGLPIALFFAWAFELTPDGVKPTNEVNVEDSIRSTTGQKINYAIIGLLAIAVVFLLFDRNSEPELLDTDNSIAVLPFADMSKNSDQAYFSDGLSEELLNVLAKIPDLKVAGRTSSFAFRGDNRDLREIGSSLNVNHILEGSVRKQDNRVRITAQLIRAEDGFNVWSETFDRELSDIFVVQEEIANSIVSRMALSMDISVTRNLISTETGNMQVYDLYLTAKALISQRGTENITRAISLLERATELEPIYAPAWAMLAQAHALAYYFPGIETAFEGMYRGEEAARRALLIDPNSSAARAALGGIMRDRYRWLEAEKHYEMALRFDPNNVEANSQYGQLLHRTNKSYQALPYLSKERQLDPLGPIYTMLEAMVRYEIGDKEEGLALYERSLELSDNSSQFPPATRFLHGLLIDSVEESQNYLRMLQMHNKVDDARYFNDSFIDLLPDQERLLAYLERLGVIYSEQPDQIQEENDFASLVFAGLAAKLGDYQLALDFLELEANLGIEHVNHVGLSNYLIDAFDSIQNDARFKQIRINYGIVDYWKNSDWPKNCSPIGEDDFECIFN